MLLDEIIAGVLTGMLSPRGKTQLTDAPTH